MIPFSRRSSDRRARSRTPCPSRRRMRAMARSSPSSPAGSASCSSAGSSSSRRSPARSDRSALAQVAVAAMAVSVAVEILQLGLVATAGWLAEAASRRGDDRRSGRRRNRALRPRVRTARCFGARRLARDAGHPRLSALARVARRDLAERSSSQAASSARPARAMGAARSRTSRTHSRGRLSPSSGSGCSRPRSCSSEPLRDDATGDLAPRPRRAVVVGVQRRLPVARAPVLPAVPSRPASRRSTSACRNPPAARCRSCAPGSTSTAATSRRT